MIFITHDRHVFALYCSEQAINLKSEWNESLEQVSAVKKAVIDSKRTSEELAFAKKACIMVFNKRLLTNN